MSTFIVIGLLLVWIYFALRNTWKDRKKGGCGCGCTGCTRAQECHKDQE